MSVIFAPQTIFLGKCLLHTEVRESWQNRYFVKTAEIIKTTAFIVNVSCAAKIVPLDKQISHVVQNRLSYGDRFLHMKLFCFIDNVCDKYDVKQEPPLSISYWWENESCTGWAEHVYLVIPLLVQTSGSSCLKLAQTSTTAWYIINAFVDVRANVKQKNELSTWWAEYTHCSPSSVETLETVVASTAATAWLMVTTWMLCQ